VTTPIIQHRALNLRHDRLSRQKVRGAVAGNVEVAINDPSIAGILRRGAERSPNGPCLTYEGQTRSWRQVYERASRVGQGLQRAGLQFQDRISYIAKNRPEFYEISFGASMAGVVIGAVNWRLAPCEMASLINHADVRILFVEEEFLPAVREIRSELRTVESVVVIGDDSKEPNPVTPHLRTSTSRLEEGFESWLRRHPAEDPQVPVSESDIALQIYTSGTTGLPKCAMFTNRAVRATFAMAEVTQVDEDSVVLVPMPVFHAAGSSTGFMALSVGAHCVIVREPDPASLLAAIERCRVTMTIVVPAVLKTLLETPGIEARDLSSLHTIAYAASPISPALLRASLERFDCRFIQIYGTTETSGVTALPPEDHTDPAHPERLLSAGKALRGNSIRVVDPATGTVVPDGTVGEVWIKAPTNTVGYWNAPDETAATVTEDGYVRSGDGGYLRDGYLYLRDRIKDMIVTGAENVYPVEVENVLLAHHAIVDAAVIGVPSEKWGETVCAILVKDPAHPELTENEVIAYVKANLAGYKCPTLVEFVGELPRNPSGKILKRELRQPFWEGRERNIG